MATDKTPEAASAVKARASAPGIYTITNTLNGKVYVGSSKNVPVRLSQHKRRLDLGAHENRLLQGAWKRDGESAFILATVELCQIQDLIAREQAWMDRLNSADRASGYNLCQKAYVPGSFPRSEEHKRKIGLANKGMRRTDDFCMRMKEHISNPALREKLNAGIRGSVKFKEACARRNAAKRTLSDDDVRDIVRRRAAGETVLAIATRFGLTRRPIRAILGGETYTHVTGLA